ncbi:sigma-70 family RNA polymerase sigma factor, partial [Kineococcus sp. T13]|uniref:sigma-70 family RNA polymerase sigma factor n=1 Tax=Kineococcus vitellinus TaxID=2696565 RepID=UPI00141220FD
PHTLPDTSDEHTRPDTAQQLADRDALLAALRTLPPKQRAVIALRHLDQMSDERIAEVLDTTVGAVRVNASRGLATLRTRIAREGAPV